MLKISRLNIQNLGSRTIERYKTVTTKFSNKVKGTFIEKTIKYLKIVAKDYKEVLISIKDDIKAKPFKSTCLFTGMGFMMFSITHNPSEQSFHAKYIQCANDVSLINSSIVNPSIVEHLKYLQQCYNKDLIRHRSLGLFSIIWVDNYSQQSGTYETNCSYLQLRYRNFIGRIIDVGFLNIWWVISRKMLDYDINY